MPSNPVGNQIRNLQGQLDNARNDLKMLLLAMETKAPEVYAEYVRLKEEAQERIEAANRPSNLQNQFNQFMAPQQRPLFQPSQPARGNQGSGSRF